jgi:site-specific DNA-adenine methylase
MSQQSQNTKLDNSTYNVMAALGREADFLHSTVDRYIEDARNDNNSELVQVWNDIKQDKQKHLDMLKRCLEKDVQQGQLKQ